MMSSGVVTGYDDMDTKEAVIYSDANGIAGKPGDVLMLYSVPIESYRDGPCAKTRANGHHAQQRGGRALKHSLDDHDTNKAVVREVRESESRGQSSPHFKGCPNSAGDVVHKRESRRIVVKCGKRDSLR